MSLSSTAADFLAAVRVDAAVTALRPDYRAVVLVAEDLTPGPPDQASEALLADAEADAAAPDHPHVLAWAEAFRGFGAKPQRTRPSVAALLRRLPELPRVDRLTDAYNAVSIRYAVPVGGEDLDSYAGTMRLTRATGDEPFETTAAGRPVLEHPEPGEVVWRDDAGVTCRRWNWRQCTRTRLTTATTRAVFVLDLLDGAAPDAADALARALRTVSPGARIEARTVRGTIPPRSGGGKVPATGEERQPVQHRDAHQQ